MLGIIFLKAIKESVHSAKPNIWKHEFNLLLIRYSRIISCSWLSLLILQHPSEQDVDSSAFLKLFFFLETPESRL